MSGSRLTRRSLFALLSRIVMLSGLVGAYGFLASFFARFLYPTRSETDWYFLATLADFPVGHSKSYVSPAGARVLVTRRARDNEATDFIAFSSTCPHLGCQVHWEPHNQRFFCPCHNGVFRPDGKAIEGPPAKAGQELPRYELMLDRGQLFIGLNPEQLMAGRRRGRPDQDLIPRGEGRVGRRYGDRA